LAKLLSWFGLGEDGNCQCNQHAKQMNSWGSDQCENHINEISEWLMQEAEERGLPSGQMSRLVARRLIRRAIRNARSKQ
jgi:hypothetical protein